MTHAVTLAKSKLTNCSLIKKRPYCVPTYNNSFHVNLESWKANRHVVGHVGCAASFDHDPVLTARFSHLISS